MRTGLKAKKPFSWDTGQGVAEHIFLGKGENREGGKEQTRIEGGQGLRNGGLT